MTTSHLPPDLPGLDLISKGFQDLSNSDQSDEALLVIIHSPELTRLGLPLPATPTLSESPEYLLYRSIEKKNPDSAHSTFNALNRRISSFIHCLEQNSHFHTNRFSRSSA